MEHTDPLSIFNEEMRHIVGSGSASTPEELYHLYIEAKFEPAYQYACAVYQLTKHLSAVALYDENDGDAIQACRLALQDWQQSAKTLNDKEDFCDWIEQGARKSF